MPPPTASLRRPQRGARIGIIAVAMVIAGVVVLIAMIRLHATIAEASESRRQRQGGHGGASDSSAAARKKAGLLRGLEEEAGWGDGAGSQVNKGQLKEPSTAMTTQPSSSNFLFAEEEPKEEEKKERQFRLNMHAEPLPKAACPVPILRPEGYAAKYGWGSRRPNAAEESCAAKARGRYAKKAMARLERWRSEGRLSADEADAEEQTILVDSPKFSRLIISSPDGADDANADADGTASIAFLHKHCKRRGVVWEFDEMPDSDFQRMQSTADAEERQNTLKNRFSLTRLGQPELLGRHRMGAGGGRGGGGGGGEDAHDEGNRLKGHNGPPMDALTFPAFVRSIRRPGADGVVRGLTLPYAIARCEGESELHIRAPEVGWQKASSGSRRSGGGGGGDANNNINDKNDGQMWQEEEAPKEGRAQNAAVVEARAAEQQRRERVAAADTAAAHGLQNILHIMFDSTSIHAQRRGARRIIDLFERLNNAKAKNPKAAGGNGKGERGEEKEDAEGDVPPSSYVYPFHHYHAVGCCSPGNQIPMYSGNMNGEGDPFVAAEPRADSRDWVWNIAAANGFRTFWSLDNCPDKSARDFHAYPSVDSRVVAPVCVAGPLLSHTALGCVADKSVDEIVIEGLEAFWAAHASERKFAMAHFISPHEPTEKLLIELDVLVESFIRRLAAAGELDKTAIILWSDHGINFGSYASTPDGEIEKLFPFANFVLPRRFAEASGIGPQLRHNMDMLTTPFDMYELSRRLLHYPSDPPPFAHDPRNPRLPTPLESHIMASFQKPITPLDPSRVNISAARDCLAANVPVEFCTCLPWRRLPVPAELQRKGDGHQRGGGGEAPPAIAQPHRSRNDDGSGAADAAASDRRVAVIAASAAAFAQKAIAAHNALLAPYSGGGEGDGGSGPCHAVALSAVLSIEAQPWPLGYQPKEKANAKVMWARPNRDMVRVTYNARAATASAGQKNNGDANEEGTFFVVFSVPQQQQQQQQHLYHGGGGGGSRASLVEAAEVSRLDRLDAMGERRCGVVDKAADHMCLCK